MGDDRKRLLTRKRRAYFHRLGEDAVMSDLDNRKYEPDLYGAAIYWLEERRQSRERRTFFRLRTFEAVVFLAILATVPLILVAIIVMGEL